MLLIGEPFEIHLPTYVSLAFIATVIAVCIVTSLRADARDRRIGHLPPARLLMLDAPTVDDVGAGHRLRRTPEGMGAPRRSSGDQ